jgi:hypothetical protein
LVFVASSAGVMGPCSLSALYRPSFSPMRRRAEHASEIAQNFADERVQFGLVDHRVLLGFKFKLLQYRPQGCDRIGSTDLRIDACHF